jgi:ketosteroid isomerase-like protein
MSIKMKYLWLILAGLLVVAGAVPAVDALSADPQTENEVKAVLKAEAEAFSRKDLVALMSLWAPDEGVVFIDDTPEAPFVGPAKIRESYERDFKRFTIKSTEFKSINIGSRGDVAWFAAEIVTLVEQPSKTFPLPGRWSGVLEKREGKWLFVQSHYMSLEEQD